MIRTYLLPLVAIVGLIVALYTVRAGAKPVPTTQPIARPAEAPFASYVAGSGLIEASTENIAIGASLSGVVTSVSVKIGDLVKRGQPLMTIDTRDLDAELVQRQAVLASRVAQLAQLKAQPRAEDVPPAEARVAAANADVGNTEAKLKLYESVADSRAVTQDDMTGRRFAAASARARLVEAESELAKLRAGAWKPDVDVAQASVDAAQADLRALQIDIDRRTICSPVDGRVLQVKIRQGEYAQAGVLATPLMLVGAVETMHVRVDVDENDAWRVQPNAKARATIRGNGALGVDLTYVGVEPYILPKKSLTGDSSERVDTRVLQVIYAFPAAALPVYVGQQMDVFMESTTPRSRQ